MLTLPEKILLWVSLQDKQGVELPLEKLERGILEEIDTLSPIVVRILKENYLIVPPSEKGLSVTMKILPIVDVIEF